MGVERVDRKHAGHSYSCRNVRLLGVLWSSLAIAAIFFVLNFIMASETFGRAQDDVAVAYAITVSSEPAEPVQFQLHVPAAADTLHFTFNNSSQAAKPSYELVDIRAYTETGRTLTVDVAEAGFTIHSEGEPFYVEYYLKLQAVLLNSSTWPDNHSLRWDDFAYIAADALLQPTNPIDGSVHGSVDGPIHIRLHMPTDWRVFARDTSTTTGDPFLRLADVHGTSIFMGRSLAVQRVPSSVGLTVVEAGALPWPTEPLAASLSALFEPLHELGLVKSSDEYTFVIARYPGALRLNPLISSQAIGEQTFMHWIGVGTIDWWRKHTIRDVVTSLARQTLRLAPDASWFSTGLAEYASLLLLFEAGFLTLDEMYQSLHNMYVTGARYTGPAWPSLILAGISHPKPHAAERVLQFRAPVTAFLFDTELRVASGGTVTLLDLWASLAERQSGNPDVVLHTADLLPPAQQFGDWSAFADDHIFGTRVIPLHFDAVFNRWVAAMKR